MVSLTSTDVIVSSSDASTAIASISCLGYLLITCLLIISATIYIVPSLAYKLLKLLVPRRYRARIKPSVYTGVGIVLPIVAVITVSSSTEQTKTIDATTPKSIATKRYVMMGEQLAVQGANGKFKTLDVNADLISYDSAIKQPVVKFKTTKLISNTPLVRIDEPYATTIASVTLPLPDHDAPVRMRVANK